MTIENKKIEDLLGEIKKLQDENFSLKKRKKYGLVWESKPEKFDEESKNALPILKEKGGKFKDVLEKGRENDDYNILIEGDNYHSLSVLSYTHKNKIDVIYIDPPYNTGNKDFIYNDTFIDKEDSFRHSKWLSFMDKRLRLAKDLLKKDGVIFISIDDNEQAQLKLLMDEIFTENNFVNNIIWQRASGGGNAKGIVTGHDYILVYQRTFPVKHFLGDKIDPKRFGKDKIVEEDGKKYFINDDVVRKVFGKYDEGIERRCYFEELDKYKNEKQIKEIKEKIINKEYFLIKQKNNLHFIARLDPMDTRKKMYSIIQGVLNNLGANEMNDLGINFSYPKPSLLLKKVISSVSNKNDLILDFMAGSGTTGHAVLDLNKEDGGNRKFILCTNNENKICENVTWERIKRVSKGYKKPNGEKVDGLGGNIKYLKTDFIKKDKSIDDLKEKIVEASTEILCLKENSFKLVKDTYEKNRIKVFENKKQYTAVLFDLFFFDNFLESLKKLKDKKIVIYIFSYGRDFSLEEFEELNGKVDFSVEAIPEKLLETYQKIFNL